MDANKLPLALLSLLIITIMGGILLLTVPIQLIRIPVGLLVILFLPGYLFLKMLWPHGQNPDGLWYLTMIFPTSIALVGILLLLINYFDTYSYTHAVILLIFMNVILALLALIRYEFTTNTPIPQKDWLTDISAKIQHYQPSGWHLLLACSFLVLLGSIIYAAITPRQTLPLTEFYVLMPDGRLPLVITQPDNSELTLKLGIKNHESRLVDYRLIVLARQADMVSELWSNSVTVADGATVEQPVNLKRLTPDTEELQLLLFMEDSQIPYRSLRLVLKSP